MPQFLPVPAAGQTARTLFDAGLPEELRVFPPSYFTSLDNKKKVLFTGFSRLLISREHWTRPVFKAKGFSLFGS